jgi:hypothetical protein
VPIVASRRSACRSEQSLGKAGDQSGARSLLAGITETRRCPWQRALHRAPVAPRAPLLTVHVYSGAMEHTSKGRIDLYWRKARKQWHCFKKIAQVRGFISLCEHHEITFVRGKEISRPEVALRCEVCDRLEMERRGWEGSGPVSLRRSISR